MRRLVALAVVACCATVAVAPSAQQATSQEPFRAGVDVIRLDVSVLDEERRPIRGLKPADFTVKEDGDVQRIVAVTEIDAMTRDPERSSWMSHVTPDVAYNDLGDQLADGRAVALVVDDRNILWDDGLMRRGAREVADYIIDGLSPSDIGAVVFANNAGNTQDFTHDRSKLHAAIDRFPTERPLPLPYLNEGQMSYGGDIQRSSYILARHKCLRDQPIVTTLFTVVSRLSSVPNQRKSIFLLSIGAPVKFMQGKDCQNVIYFEMLNTFRLAQRANINIHGIDPAGYEGYRSLLATPRIVKGRFIDGMDSFAAGQRAAGMQDYLREVTGQTGGRAVVSASDTLGEIDQIFTESASYYLIGYESSHGKPDGRFRRLEVDVNRPKAKIHALKGYWAPEADGALAKRREAGADRNDLNLSGMMPAPRLALRLAAHPVAVSRGADGQMTIAAVLTVRLPPLRTPVTEFVRVIRTVYDVENRPATPVQDEHTIAIEPQALGAPTYDLMSRFSLPPGRYEVRLNANSRTADANSSVYAVVDVPDVRRSALSLSDLVLSTGGSADAGGPFTDVLPITPTTTRSFTRNDRVAVFLRLFQGSSLGIAPVHLQMRLFDTSSQVVLDRQQSISAEAFTKEGAEWQANLPLVEIPEGLYLLHVTAQREGAAPARREVVFQVK